MGFIQRDGIVLVRGLNFEVFINDCDHFFGGALLLGDEDS
jgi:hypothetical protein